MRLLLLATLVSIVGISTPTQAQCEANTPMPTPDLSIFPVEYDMEKGEEVLRLIEVNWKMSDDPVITGYLNRLLFALAAVAPDYTQAFSYRTLVHVTPELDAISFRNGVIVISAGFIANAPSEDFLAAVLGHEIAHAALRHRSALETRQELYAFENRVAYSEYQSPRLEGNNEWHPKVLFLLLREAARRFGSLPQIRIEQEREADLFGVRVALKAGFNPRSLAELYTKDLSNGLGYIDLETHPPSRVRQKLLECEMQFQRPRRREQRPPEFRAAQARAKELLAELATPK